MIVLEIIGWVLLSLLGLILLLLVLLCSLKLSLQAGYCQTLLLKVGIGPVTLNLSDSMQMSKEEAEEFTKKKKKKKAAKPKKKTVEKQEKPPKYTEKPALTEIITAFKDLAVGILTRFARHIKLEELRLRVLAASDDAENRPGIRLLLRRGGDDTDGGGSPAPHQPEEGEHRRGM